jgi:hypothetical protein
VVISSLGCCSRDFVNRDSLQHHLNLRPFSDAEMHLHSFSTFSMTASKRQLDIWNKNYKRSSLFGHFFSYKEISFLTLTSEIKIVKLFHSLMMRPNKLVPFKPFQLSVLFPAKARSLPIRYSHTGQVTGLTFKH